ncbi:MAG TPA: helix-turn-helix domain-containing protein, partial [Spirochaetota bacterium]|nr:helix-turn-helix domain-containing protein [Spirochaetota bacterium]
FLMNRGRRIRPKKFLRFLPAVVILVAEIALQTGWPEEAKKKVLHELFTSRGFSLLLPLLFVGGAIFIAYQVMVVIEGLQLWNDARIKKGVRLIVMLEIVNILLPVPIIIWMFFRFHSLFLVSGLITAFVMLTVFLFNNRFPRIFNLMKRELVRRKYERSFLRGVDTGSMRERIFYLMEEEKVYRDSELTLRSLAATMKLTPHQLSQFLNEKLQTSFTRFVNSYRVEEAKGLLAKNREHTVLNVCFIVGFSSKSSFNTIFKNFTGQTPTEYRKNF